MDPMPRDSWSESDSERTFHAFESSEVDPRRGAEREGSPDTSAETETKTRTPDGVRTTRSGSSFPDRWDDDNAIPADEEGNLFGKYRIIRRLGGGGMGSVWLVEHVGLEQQRALKVIKADVAESETNRRRFHQEAIILARLSRHPNAVVVYDTGIVGKFAYIDMDYQEGQTLRKRLDETGPMPVHDVLGILGEICAVLGEAHRQKIVHRDIKPQNVMIVPDPAAPRGERVKVLDFGIAKVVHEAAGETYASLTQDGMGVLGTIPYSSPEQLGLLEIGQAPVAVDHRSDLYSLGVMLYEMLAGARPFTGTQTKILYDHAHTPPPPFAEIAPAVHVPPAVEEVVRRCLEKDPARRPQSVRELLEGFSEAAGVEMPIDTILPAITGPPLEEGWPIRITKTPSHEELGAFLLRHRRAILGGLATAVIFMGVLAAIVYRRGPSVTTRPTTPLNVPPRIVAWLEKQGFAPDPDGEMGERQWPRRIRQSSGATPKRMVQHGNYYLPMGFDEDTPAGTSEKTGLPRALSREGRRFVLLEGDRFLMGNFNALRPKDKEPISFDRDEEPGHEVTLSSFYIQATEVSIGEFERFCADRTQHRTDPDVQPFFDAWRSLADLRGQKPEDFRNHPATGVSRRLAREYARWIGGDLPTEAQWEFAARSGGKPQRYGWGDDDRSVRDMANVSSPERGPFQVDFDGNKDKTEQGLYHMAGNVREWCRDPWGIYLSSSKERVNPSEKPDEGDPETDYVIRGGSYETTTETARATWRSKDGIPGTAYIMKADGHQQDLGFRVALEIMECPRDLGTSSEITAWREAGR